MWSCVLHSKSLQDGNLRKTFRNYIIKSNPTDIPKHRLAGKTVNRCNILVRQTFINPWNYSNPLRLLLAPCFSGFVFALCVLKLTVFVLLMLFLLLAVDFCPELFISRMSTSLARWYNLMTQRFVLLYKYIKPCLLGDFMFPKLPEAYLGLRQVFALSPCCIKGYNSKSL